MLAVQLLMGLRLRPLVIRTPFLGDASIALMTSILPLFLREDLDWIHSLSQSPSESLFCTEGAERRPHFLIMDGGQGSGSWREEGVRT